MNIFHVLLLSLTYHVVFIYCIENSDQLPDETVLDSKPCFKLTCDYTFIIFFSTVIVVTIVSTLFLYCCKYHRGRPFRTNSIYVKSFHKKKTNEQIINENMNFETGKWMSRYVHHRLKYGPHENSLTFNSESSTIIGLGSDDIGKFLIEGIYSIQTNRIAFIKSYQLGTGNRLTNHGQQMIVQLKWMSKRQQFEGKWYVHSTRYHEEGKFELKRQETSLLWTSFSTC